MSTLPFLLGLFLNFLPIIYGEKMCRRYVCNSKTNDLSSDAINRICMYEKNTAKDLFKVLVYPTMCKGTILNKPNRKRILRLLLHLTG